MPLKPEPPVFRRAKGTPPPPVEAPAAVETPGTKSQSRKKKIVRAKVPQKVGSSVLASKTYGLISQVSF